MNNQTHAVAFRPDDQPQVMSEDLHCATHGILILGPPGTKYDYCTMLLIDEYNTCSKFASDVAGNGGIYFLMPLPCWYDVYYKMQVEAPPTEFTGLIEKARLTTVLEAMAKYYGKVTPEEAQATMLKAQDEKPPPAAPKPLTAPIMTPERAKQLAKQAWAEKYYSGEDLGCTLSMLPVHNTIPKGEVLAAFELLGKAMVEIGFDEVSLNGLDYVEGWVYSPCAIYEFGSTDELEWAKPLEVLGNPEDWQLHNAGYDDTQYYCPDAQIRYRRFRVVGRNQEDLGSAEDKALVERCQTDYEYWQQQVKPQLADW